MSLMLSRQRVAKTANYTVTKYDGIIDCTANSFDVTLLSAAGLTGREFTIKNSGSGTITLKTTSSQTIDDQASGTLTLNPNESITVFSDGSNWQII